MSIFHSYKLNKTTLITIYILRYKISNIASGKFIDTYVVTTIYKVQTISVVIILL